MDAGVIGALIGPLVPISFFAMIAAIVVVPQILRSRERARLHETLRSAYEKGQPVPPELIEALQGNRALPLPNDRQRSDLRTGVIWLFVGLGFIGIGGLFYWGLYNVGGSIETFTTFAAIGAIPVFVGLAFLVLSLFARTKPR
jgi:hypothetical protein